MSENGAECSEMVRQTSKMIMMYWMAQHIRDPHDHSKCGGPDFGKLVSH